MEYVTTSTAWSVSGLIVGYSLGKTERTVVWLRRYLEDHDDGGPRGGV